MTRKSHKRHSLAAISYVTDYEHHIKLFTSADHKISHKFTYCHFANVLSSVSVD